MVFLIILPCFSSKSPETFGRASNPKYKNYESWVIKVVLMVFLWYHHRELLTYKNAIDQKINLK